MKSLAVATFARSEFSSLLPLLRQLRDSDELESHLIVGGSHLEDGAGYTYSAIQKEGFEADYLVPMPLVDDSAASFARALSQGLQRLADIFATQSFDMIMVVGDRLELLSVLAAAIPFGLAIAHISGGDVTEGALDDQVRHAVSKASHLHFVSMEKHAERLRQMGEEDWRVKVTGDPALDLAVSSKLSPRTVLEEHLGLTLSSPVILVTHHPTTLSDLSATEEVNAVLDGLEAFGEATVVMTRPNLDPGNLAILSRMEDFANKRPTRRVLVPNLGSLYYSMIAHSDVMVGNSSSGIWEAPSFKKPVVNVGSRQDGRLKAANILDTPPVSKEISQAIRRALSQDFRSGLSDLRNPYGDGNAAMRIVKEIIAAPGGIKLLKKRFVERDGQ